MAISSDTIQSAVQTLAGLASAAPSAPSTAAPSDTATSTNGGISHVQQTAKWTAYIATGAASLCMVITMVALSTVVIRDGNTELVNTAMATLAQLGIGILGVIATAAVGPQVVSGIVSRIQNASTTGSNQAQ